MYHLDTTSIYMDKEFRMSDQFREPNKFPLTFYGSTEYFPFGATQDEVLEYIKDTKGGSGGTFDAVYKNGDKVAFLEDVFEKDEDIIGYEFEPADYTYTTAAAVAPQVVTKEDTSIEPLYVPSDAPSSTMDAHQRDRTYYSPCSNAFVLAATRLAYEDIPPATMQDATMVKLAENLVKDIRIMFDGFRSSKTPGYFSLRKAKDAGVTALITANLEKCYTHYCSMHLQLQQEKTYFMHKCTTTKPIKASIDMGLFYRFDMTDQPSFIRNALYPMGFVTFTTKEISEKFPQASAYANAMFRMMKFEEMRAWIPLLGVVMNTTQFIVKLYSLTIVDISSRFEAKKQWKIAEVVIEKFKLDSTSVLRLVHVMVGWVKYCAHFLTSASPNSRVGSALLLDRLHLQESDVAFIDKHVYKCYDYRSISHRNTFGARRDPKWYYQLGDLNVESVVEWQSPQDNDDCLKIIRYPIVEGAHEPIYVKHLALLHMHSQNVVHGDLRFANVVFSKADVSPPYSKLIDFDYCGIDGEKEYSKRLNMDLPDGNRHPEVLHDEVLYKYHDVHSFAWMCSRYRPKSDDLRASWQEWIDSEGGDLTKGLERFENISDAEELEQAVTMYRVPRGRQNIIQ